MHTCLIRSAIRFGEALVASSSDLLTPSTVSSISQLRALVSTFENVMDEYWEDQTIEEGFAKSDCTALDDISTHCTVFEGSDSIFQHKVGLSSRKKIQTMRSLSRLVIVWYSFYHRTFGLRHGKRERDHIWHCRQSYRKTPTSLVLTCERYSNIMVTTKYARSWKSWKTYSRSQLWTLVCQSLLHVLCDYTI